MNIQSVSKCFLADGNEILKAQGRIQSRVELRVKFQIKIRPTWISICKGELILKHESVFTLNQFVEMSTCFEALIKVEELCRSCANKLAST